MVALQFGFQPRLQVFAGLVHQARHTSYHDLLSSALEAFEIVVQEKLTL